ncbi:hypothetical protein BDN70DRAFT_929436 [Pholiota conissans]|uniref:Transmembrane protein n=1 Tax=Pholiota conissans TaxID=109636 RepID=A0A9P6D4H2_9AGAR|nr:hypothetical protein BDN70DRAFT_929436 [Pholiota conissans]
MTAINSQSSEKACLRTHSQISSSSSASSSTSGRCTNTHPSMGEIHVTLTPPLPAYSLPSSFHNAIAISPDQFTQGIDADVVRHNLTHGRGDAVVRCTPESYGYPEYEGSNSSLGLRASRESLPPYGANLPPRYTRFYLPSQPDEPKTLTRTFFKLGFLFPILWLLGAAMLFTPPRSPKSSSMDTRTEQEKVAFLEVFRAAEKKWAKRCLFSFGLFLCVCVAFAAMAYGILKSTQNNGTPG